MYENTFSSSSSSIAIRLAFERGASGRPFYSPDIPALLHSGITTFDLSVGRGYNHAAHAPISQHILGWLGTHCPNITSMSLPIELFAFFPYLFSGPSSLTNLIIRPPVSSMSFSAQAASASLSKLLQTHSSSSVRLTLPLELGQLLPGILQDIARRSPTLRELTFDIGDGRAYPDAIVRARLFGALAAFRGSLSSIRFPLSEYTISMSSTERGNLEGSLRAAVGPRAAVYLFHPRGW
ncbi:hypothetical protein CYLTODRAFT_494301 [Cylindrobasidium torrendii FP15055 ss-10]|uniref:Uncharacterized protein n=1 Tax=Cylindrobasidium torrendii FP15055 ss-10 TaxID=1314674 RepID=A0A0D7AYF2_9AGAR|nr:hypothetical protein CYLTODRAFT_494301 [Cylindrobasidium torrendii FP15055 ss-10]